MKLTDGPGAVRSLGWGLSGRHLLIFAVTIAALTLTFALPAVSQSERYHGFADQRALAGLPNSLNVLSNFPFIAVGIFGLWGLSRGYGSQRPVFLDSRERWPYITFFVGVFLVGLGSSYYHLFPSNESLVWDRLPISLVLVAFACSQIAERVSPRGASLLLPPLIVVGFGSVFYWWFTELLGQGDLRLYGFIRFLPMVLVPLLVWLFPARYTGSPRLILALVLFAGSSVLEIFDETIWELGRFVSGHTLKHLVAAAAAYLIWQMLKVRQPVGAAASQGDA